MGHAYANYFSKTYIVCYRKNAPKSKNFTISFPGKTPLKLKQMPKKNQTITIPHLLKAQPTIALLLLVCYCGSTTMCRQNGNCADPNQTDSQRAG